MIRGGTVDYAGARFRGIRASVEQCFQGQGMVLKVSLVLENDEAIKQAVASKLDLE